MAPAMRDRAPSPAIFEFNSGRLCLDFTNTVRARPLSDRVESINKYDDLLDWSRQATILTPGEAGALAQQADRRARQAAEALARAIALREAIHGLFSARAAGLPARVVAGVVYLDGAFYYHAWSEVWLGRWIAADPVFHQFPADATHIKFVEGGPEEHLALLKIIGKIGMEIVEDKG